MRALLVLVLPLAALLAGCSSPVPSAEAECLAPTPTWARYDAEFPPLHEDWEAQAIFEEHGWVVQPDAGPGSRADNALFYAAYRASETLELRAFVGGGRGAPTFVHVEAVGTQVVSATAAAQLLEPHVAPLEAAFAARLGAPTARLGYSGGEACAK